MSWVVWEYIMIDCNLYNMPGAFVSDTPYTTNICVLMLNIREIGTVQIANIQEIGTVRTVNIREIVQYSTNLMVELTDIRVCDQEFQ